MTSGIIICLTMCWACKFDNCPNTPHSWGDVDDWESAWLHDRPAPGFCGCSCGRPERLSSVEA